ncbi:MAG: crossover junction endodeoxyribonuclease RuvC [Gammaproteobacteria bacterium]|jgi:crossover junction endodeoxyribonuclease RuvC
MTAAVTILGIDPGSQVTGFGVITAQGSSLAYVASGCIRTGGGEMAARLQVIFESASRLVDDYRPDEISIERVFMHRNADSALKLGQARAAALCGTFTRAVPVHEYAPREVKQAVTGSGGAEKAQVAHMVRRLLALDGPLAADAADALAIAITHAQLRQGRLLRTRLAGGGQA